MSPFIAFPIPVDDALAPWLAPVFGLMALTSFAVLVWQAVRYLRRGDDDENGQDNSPDR